MHCANCGHAHESTEQRTCLHTTDASGNELRIHGVESTLMVCTEPGCDCTHLSPIDYEDRIELIKSGAIDP